MPETEQQLEQQTKETNVSSDQEITFNNAMDVPVQDLPGKWYIIHAFTGHEDKVRRLIEQQIKIDKLEKKIFRILLPEEQTIEIKSNKRIERTQKMFPGYVFINMIYDEDLWFTIRQIPSVAKFIGRREMPEQVQEAEILKVLNQSGEKISKKIEVDFEVGESIKVISGPFRGYAGNIAEIYAEKGKMKVLISIFGRETPMEINFDQAEKNI
jgi:transcriptional antiterminator NusG